MPTAAAIKKAEASMRKRPAANGDKLRSDALDKKPAAAIAKKPTANDDDALASTTMVVDDDAPATPAEDVLAKDASGCETKPRNSDCVCIYGTRY